MLVKSWNYPGPFNVSPVGAGYLFMFRPEYILKSTLKLQAKYPDGLKLWMGNHLIYCLHKSEKIEKILGTTKLL
ncbi:hypothetical protein ABEB36_007786 [Hypothenemus hampei]|uniref:Uncharacterized protein n=1 Tax=Hypothenemus hampei TaxID=57062 RepID=A0ABD1EVR7_HYPHA